MNEALNAESLLRFASDHQVEVIDLRFCNLLGTQHHLTLPVEKLTSELFERGVGIDGSSIPGFKVQGGSDLLVIPDPTTAVLDPFWERITLGLICNIHETGSLASFNLDPRRVLQAAEGYMISNGIADRSIWGPEFEFYIFDSVTFVNEINSACYRIDSAEADWNRCQDCSEDNSNTIPPHSGYHAAPPQDRYYLLRDRMCAHIAEFGVKVKYHHHEVGGPGQSEIEIETGPILQSADAGMNVKYVCKMVARQEGCCVTFMPKPLYNEAGSGMHFHQQLFLGDKPLFYSKDGYAGLSDIALHYVGGLLAHGPALLAFTNPSTNSYKRLVPGFEAPVKAIYGLGNRSAAVRVPKYADTPNKKRIEFRPPDGTANIYLAMAAQLMAGLDGIEKRIDPAKMGFGPFDSDLHTLDPQALEAIPSLPASLAEALNALEADNEFLLKGGVFPPDLIGNWIDLKRNRDLREIAQRPHPYEMRLYFDL